LSRVEFWKKALSRSVNLCVPLWNLLGAFEITYNIGWEPVQKNNSKYTYKYIFMCKSHVNLVLDLAKNLVQISFSSSFS
jgi:hypothetical protein